MKKLIAQLLTYSLLLPITVQASSSCHIGDIFKQTKTLNFFSLKTRTEARVVVSRQNTLFLKITKDRRWGCEVQFYRKIKGQLKKVNNERFIVSYKYLKRGTIETIINDIVTIPQKVDDQLTPKITSCSTKPKESYSNRPPQKTDAPALSKTGHSPFSSYSHSPAVEKMLNTLKSNCAKFCCGRYCYNKLPNANWCHSKYKRYWNAKIRKKQCRRSIGRCYGYVKLGLLASGKLDNYLKQNKIKYPWTPTGNASDGGYLLKKAGYQNILHHKRYKNISAFNAPRGAILVYKAIPRGPGHIEVVDVLPNGKRKYYSDFVGDAPITNNPMFPYLNGTGRRKLIGIYLPKEHKE